MAISLSDFEQGSDFDGDYDAALSDLQDRLERIQTAHIVHDRRSVILFEGWDASGKGGIIKRLTANLDPRYYQAQSAPSCDFGQVGERFGNVAFGIDDGNHRRGQFAPS